MLKLSQEKCTGCTACYAACPVGAITLRENPEGFTVPGVDSERCRRCDLCNKVCPVLSRTKEKTENFHAFWVKSNDEEILKQSSSGGLFFQLASLILRRGGCVCGALIDHTGKVRHRLIETMEELPSLLMSKYVQSDLGECFGEIRKLLNAGRSVLFCGTPCQLAGLFSVDFACHGVPSPGVWRSYLQKLIQGYRSLPKEIFFRDKSEGWELYSLKILFLNRKIYRKRLDVDPFLRGFLNNFFLRDSCYQCPFKGKSAADLTLADAWGIQKVKPEFHSGRGVSCCVIRSEKGRELWKELCSGIEYLPADIETVYRYNTAFMRSVELRPEREIFFRLWKSGMSVEQAVYFCLRENCMMRLRKNTRRTVKQIISYFLSYLKKSR